MTGSILLSPEWGSGHIILLILQLKRLYLASNMVLKWHFWGEKYPIKERKAHSDGESKKNIRVAS
jgi:hypothetical protein